MDDLQFWSDVGTIVIAVCALFISIWSTAAARKHNKLSVKPILIISKSSKEVPGSDGIYVENCGFGPAIIERSKIFFNDKQLASGSSHYLIHQIKKQLGEFGFTLDCAALGKGDAIQPGAKYKLFGLGPNDYYSDLDNYHQGKFVTAIFSLNWKIKYGSIYEDFFEVEGPPSPYDEQGGKT